MVHSPTTSRTAVDLIVDTAATTAIKGGTPIDRARDIVAASQHLVVNDRGMVGRVWMGKPAGVIMI